MITGIFVRGDKFQVGDRYFTSFHLARGCFNKYAKNKRVLKRHSQTCARQDLTALKEATAELPKKIRGQQPEKQQIQMLLEIINS